MSSLWGAFLLYEFKHLLITNIGYHEKTKLSLGPAPTAS